MSSHTDKVKPEFYRPTPADENTSHAAGTPMITAQPTSLTANSLTGASGSNHFRAPAPAIRTRIAGSQMNVRGNRKSNVARIASGSPPMQNAVMIQAATSRVATIRSSVGLGSFK